MLDFIVNKTRSFNINKNIYIENWKYILNTSFMYRVEGDDKTDLKLYIKIYII